MAEAYPARKRRASMGRAGEAASPVREFLPGQEAREEERRQVVLLDAFPRCERPLGAAHLVERLDPRQLEIGRVVRLVPCLLQDEEGARDLAQVRWDRD